VTAPAKRQPIPFGKYLLLDRINIGGMAEVWRGKMFGAGGFERLVAIKRILPNIAEDEEFITMFIDEAKITVQLTHANVAQVYELGQIANNYFIAMEYIPGKDMRAIFDRCRKKGEPAPVPLVCFMVAKMCEGLDYAHRKKDGMGRDMNIVHRDISPQNVLISYEGEVKVIDFGIAKAAGKATKTQAGILKGKFAYMSPEQIRGLPLDRRSDVFAIGICLYEMLTGERLFVGDSDFSVLEKVRKAEVLPPSTYNRRIPEALEKIVLRALAKDVEDRYQYANELGDDLQRFLITSDSIFSRKDLMQYMKSTFAEDVEREKVRIQDYADIRPSEGMLAAIEMGYSGAAGGGGVPAHTPSAPIPLVAPAAVPQPQATAAGPRLTATAMSAMPAPRQSSPQNPVVAPPSLAPAATAGTQVPRRSPSLASMPKLTAAAPILTNQQEENGATMLVDNNHFFSDAPEPRTEPGGVLKAAASSGPPEPRVLSAHEEISGTAVVAAPPGRRPSRPHPQPQRPSAPSVVTGSVTDPGSAVDEDDVTSPQARSARAAPAPKAPAAAGLNKVIVGVAVALFLALAGVGVVLFSGPGEGFLYVEVPPELQGKARLSINGKELGEEITWPYFQKVPAGPTAVLITADGYQPVAESVQVVKGNDITRVVPAFKRR
jgi:serine/threonine protein kinase